MPVGGFARFFMARAQRDEEYPTSSAGTDLSFALVPLMLVGAHPVVPSAVLFK